MGKIYILRCIEALSVGDWFWLPGELYTVAESDLRRFVSEIADGDFLIALGDFLGHFRPESDDANGLY